MSRAAWKVTSCFLLPDVIMRWNQSALCSLVSRQAKSSSSINCAVTAFSIRMLLTRESSSTFIQFAQHLQEISFGGIIIDFSFHKISIKHCQHTL